MLDIGWPELLVIAIVLIVVVGPKDLPRMLRTFGRTTNKLRAMAGDFRKQFDDALKEAELDEVKNLAAEARKLDPTAEIRKNLDPMKKMGDDIKAGLEGAMKSSPPIAETGKKPIAGNAAAPSTPAGGKVGAAKPPASTAAAAGAAPAAAKKAPAKAKSAGSAKAASPSTRKAPGKAKTAGSAGRKTTGAAS